MTLFGKEPTSKSDVKHCGTCGAVLGEYYETGGTVRHTKSDCIKFLVARMGKLEKIVDDQRKSLDALWSGVKKYVRQHCPNCGVEYINAFPLKPGELGCSSREMRIPLTLNDVVKPLPY